MTSTSTGTITSYDWDFGDGSAHATAASTQHQYSKGGIYHVTLTVGNSAGSSSVTPRRDRAEPVARSPASAPPPSTS